MPKALESHLAYYFEEKGDDNCQTRRLEPAKCNRAIKIGHHWQGLYRLGLFPSRRFSTSSIDNVAHRMLEYRNWVPDGGAETCGCIDMKETLVRMSAVCMRKDGFCLNCVRKGKFTQKDGHCSLRVPVSNPRLYSKARYTDILLSGKKSNDIWRLGSLRILLAGGFFVLRRGIEDTLYIPSFSYLIDGMHARSNECTLSQPKMKPPQDEHSPS